MKNPLRKFRKIFAKPKKMNATAVRNAAASTYDEETDDTKLSGAFVIVLILHIVAVVGIVAFTKIKDNRKNNEASSALAPAKDKKAAASPAATAGLGGSKAPQVVPDVPQVNVPVVDNQPPKTPPSASAQIHIVKPGDTYTKLAMAYGTTVAELTRVNGSRPTDPLSIGQTLSVPDKNSLPPLPVMPERQNETVKNSPPKPTTPTVPTVKTATYIVKKGDSPMKIARDNGMSYEEFTKLNRSVDAKTLKPGQVVKVQAKK